MAAKLTVGSRKNILSEEERVKKEKDVGNELFEEAKKMSKENIDMIKNVLQKNQESYEEYPEEDLGEEIYDDVDEDIEDENVDEDIEDENVDDDVDEDEDEEDVETEEYKNQFVYSSSTPFESNFVIAKDLYEDLYHNNSGFSSEDFEELKNFIWNTAGSFYATYISHFHPSQLAKGGDVIRKEAAKEIISFAKVILSELKSLNKQRGESSNETA